MVIAQLSKVGPVRREEEMNIMQMVQKMGYPIMNYEVVSEDGQKLTVHRIPGPKGEKA